MLNSNTTQIAPLMNVGQDFDVDRYNKDYHVFMQEVFFFKKSCLTSNFNKLISLKNKQDDLQRVTAVLIQQNNEILQENKILWSEVLKNRSIKILFSE